MHSMLEGFYCIPKQAQKRHAVLWGQPLIYLPYSKQNPTSAPMLMGFNIFSMFFISVKLVGIVAPSLQLTTT
jgi:hypothetical protein